MPFVWPVTIQQLSAMLPVNKNVGPWHAAFLEILPKYEITTAKRIAAFVAQTAHESNDYTILKENLNYSQQGLRRVFSKYFPDDATAARYARQPAAIANRVYAGRMGNGSETSGDGFRYRGRGLIQLTGCNNYTAFSKSIGKSVAEAVDYVETPTGALESACWFWTTNNLNQIADVCNITLITKVINGGTNGLEDRQARYRAALEILQG